MCQVSEWPKLKRADDMSLEDYKALLESQIGLIEIKLQGMGEPLMGKCYAEMIYYARNKHIWVRSTTNGSLLHLGDNYKRVIDADICELQVSFDGATPETYESIRMGGKFRAVARNCDLLNQYARDSGRTRTRMWVVVQKANVHELALFPQLASELGFNRLTFSLHLNDWGQEHWRQLNQGIDAGSKLDLSSLTTLVRLGRQHDVGVTFWAMDQKYETGDPARICPWPFARAYVSSDMRIVPCCIVANPDVSDLGNARQLAQEWNNEKMIEFRRSHLHGPTPEMCKLCYKAPLMRTNRYSGVEPAPPTV
jgi:pyrroloquinoline quinone biosynthesis protein E